MTKSTNLALKTDQPGLTPKTHLLKSAGYVYDFDRAIYINRQARKVFSLEYVEDHPTQVLRRLINRKNPRSSWAFYFNSPPPLDVRRDLERSLG